MAYYSSKNVLRLLKSFNTQWENGGFSPPCPGFRRSAFYIAEKWYVKNYTKPVLIEGGHAFGKTTLLKQMLAALLERGVPPGNILYLSFDYPLTRNKSAAEIIEIYRRESCSGSPLFCLLDNVEYASEFVDFCKTAGGGTHVHVLAASSAHIDGLNGTCPFIRYIPMSGITFYEYCEYHGFKPDERTPFVYPADFHTQDISVITAMHRGLEPLSRYLEDYIRSGGYFDPNGGATDELLYAKAVDKTLMRDIPLLFEVRGNTDVEKVFVYLCYLSSGTISVNSISKALRISRATVERYIDYFEKTNLITIHESMDWETLSSVKGFKKIYINNYRMRNCALNVGGADTAAFDTDIKNAVKVSFIMHFRQFFQDGTALGFFKKNAAAKRTDIVVRFPAKINALINVQYADQVQLRANDWLLTLADKTYPNYLVTKKASDYGMVYLEDGRSVCKIPAYAILYLFGYFEKYRPMLRGDENDDL